MKFEDLHEKIIKLYSKFLRNEIYYDLTVHNFFETFLLK